MSQLFIGEVSQLLGLSIDTLRYYEKSGLIHRVSRNDAGRRVYDEKNISQLRFIQRTKKMHFSLAEISELIKMRQSPQTVKDDIRQLTAQKLSDIETQIDNLSHLRNELRSLLNLCHNSKKGCPCPIIENFDNN